MIKQNLTDEYAFWEWQQKSDNYRDQFSLEGAKALFNYFDELSDELGEDIEFDPIAWLCYFTEYNSLAEAYKELRYDYSYVEGEAREYFNDNATLIELGNGHVLIGAF